MVGLAGVGAQIEFASVAAFMFSVIRALRIDLNTAERPLIVGALPAAGAHGTADDLATKIIGHRAGPTPLNG